MKHKKFISVWIGYLIITFIVAAGWHLVLFKGLYDELGIFTRKEPIILLGILSMILQGAVLAYLYPLFYRGGNPVKEGIAFGILMGIFMGSNAVLAEAAHHHVSSLSTWLVLESVYYLLAFSLVGLAIGLIFGRNTSR
ncbi:DUF1761 domain-containing protein [bacterium]|nr:MAG: DUF1761 domain-containing protein [bacterium]